jgi:hypothetical protein
MPSLLKERTGIHDNIDEKLIYPEIKAAQDLYIRPLLGSTLFNKLLTDINAGTLTGNYKSLVDDYVIDTLCNYTLSELPEGLNFQFWNKGLSKKEADQSQTPSMSEMYAIVSKYKNRAEHYAKRCRLYLVQNATTMFPEYNQYVPGVDVTPPETNNFNCPIYLGEDRIEVKARYNPGYNSNDPYYH